MKNARFKNFRLDFALFLFLVTFGVVAARLFQIQIIKHDRYAALADEQHWNYQKLPARRGTIFTADGFPLASTELNYLLYAEPKAIPDPSGLAQKLAPIVEPEKYASAAAERDIKTIKNMELDLENKLSLNLFWVAVKHFLTKEQRVTIEALGEPGLGFEEEPVRFYPEKEMACHLLGFVARNEEGLEQGYYGLEGFYDGDLRGRAGRVYEETDASGKPILVGGFRRLPAGNGRDMVLTVDRSVQFLVEQRIRSGVERFGAKSGTVIVMDPHTGAVLAMANFPGFDPSERVFEEETDELNGDQRIPVQERRNLAIAATYEPGSVMKALTMGAGLNEGEITPRTEFTDSEPIEASGYWVDTWDKRHHGVQNMVQVLQKSNNCGAAFVGRKLGISRLREYFLKFGLGEVAGIDLEGEDTGIVNPEKEWREIDLLTASFGQGISVTPLQMVRAFAAIVNGGVLMKPYAVSEIREGARIIRVEPQKARRVISESSSRVLVDMLTAAVEGGESKFYNLERYRVAGKTGTAQIPVGGRYDPRKTNATFIGFFPSDPRFVMLIKFEEPSSSIYAAETAVPVWMEIAKELAAYYNIGPDK